MTEQLSLFDIESVYLKEGRELSNEELYAVLSDRYDIPISHFQVTTPVGKAKQPVNLLKRQVRWYQQTLKSQGVLEKVPNARGFWRPTKEAKTELKENLGKASVVAFSTRLGVAIWGMCEPTFKGLDAPITLCLTSPPYPLNRPRAYNNPEEGEYIDFICRSLEPIVEQLVDGGSIALNISNEIFVKGSPARSLYREKLVIALCERLGLYKMDELIWRNPCKPPGPVAWASKERKQLNVEWEPIYWFTNNPAEVKSDNRRVLQPHSERHLAYLNSNDRKLASHSDGAYQIRENSYRNVTKGKIPRNILTYPHNCKDQSAYKAKARNAGLPAHGAPYPLELARFIIEFMSQDGDLIVDPFAGSLTTAKAAESLNRRWLCTEKIHEYLAGSIYRFENASGLKANSSFFGLN